MEYVKEIFEDQEYPFIYDIEKDEIVNPNRREESDDEPTQEY